MTVTLGNRSAIPAPRRGSSVFERARTVTEPALRAAVDSLPPTTRRAVGFHFGWWDSEGNDRHGFRTARRKTGALLECGAGLGGLFGGGTAAQIATLGGFGAELGLALQPTDDRLGIWGGIDATGKPAHWDLLHRKRSLPVAAALDADGWRDWCGTESERHLRAALDQIEPGITAERRHDLRAIAWLVGDRDR
ncbi:MAG TPA: polyprenyl synthetase family protein [Asanoa sp.]|nr:polyprenyl synthetase family protein [Asanoa sp.]